MTKVRVSDEQWNELFKLCKLHEEAAQLIVDAWNFAVVYDNAIDGDKTSSQGETHAAFDWALTGLVENPFYQQHAAVLTAALRTAMIEWRTANELERSNDREKLVTAYILRCSPYTLFTTIVLLAGGFELAMKASLYFRTLPYVTDTLDAYLKEHLKE